MKIQIKTNETIFEITEKYPETIDILVANGFVKLQEKSMRESIGKTMTLATICKMQKVDLTKICSEMEATINTNSHENIIIKGVLPCPIRLPLVDIIDEFINSNNSQIKYTLPAASTGLDWLIDEIHNDNLADVYMSAGFGLFFDKNGIGKYAKQGKFAEYNHTYNSDFHNHNISLKDSNNIYTVIGIVPAIFMVNKTLLGADKMPTSWTDLLDEKYENKIAIPMKDLDLFNAVLLGMYTKYGIDSVAKLGKNMLKDMHPAQMVQNKSHNKTPLISVAPYFFSSMLKDDSEMVAVWPEDGAIVSPIFLISKSDTQEKTAPIIDFFTSKKIGEVLSANGKFPTTIDGVDNNLSPDKKFIFPGFDFLNNNDIGTLLTGLESTFLG